MLVTQSDADDLGRYASRDELARALGRLSSADFKRLELIARMRSTGLASTEWRDLLQEALTRALAGGRRWPRSVPLVAFLAQVMRSLASEIRMKNREVELDTDGFELAAAENGQAALEAADQLRAIKHHFDKDPQAITFLEGLLRGETARETQLHAELSSQNYDSARKRFWRGVAALNGDIS